MIFYVDNTTFVQSICREGFKVVINPSHPTLVCYYAVQQVVLERGLSIFKRFNHHERLWYHMDS